MEVSPPRQTIFSFPPASRPESPHPRLRIPFIPPPPETAEALQSLPSLPPPSPEPSIQLPELNVKLSLPKSRYDKNSNGLRLRLTATLAPHVTEPLSFYRRGTIFDELCPLLGRGGFWGIADSQRRPVRVANDDAASIKKGCTRAHADGEAFLEFGDSFVTLYPGDELILDKLLPAKDLKHLHSGEAYTIYSRPDREKKKPARARCKWGTREELAESAFWMGEADDEWTKLDVSHIVRDRDWEELVVIVGNSVRFHVR